MKSAALIALLGVLVIGHVKGQRDALGRCWCRGAAINAVRPNRIQKLTVLPASPSCPNIEIIVMLEDGSNKCLNPQSTFTKNLLNRFIKPAEKGSETIETGMSREATASPASVGITTQTAVSDHFTASHPEPQTTMAGPRTKSS